MGVSLFDSILIFVVTIRFKIDSQFKTDTVHSALIMREIMASKQNTVCINCILYVIFKFEKVISTDSNDVNTQS